ncbi:MAG: hypothetical protein IT343_23295 [Candidatus Melainabacteria bacterium]|jgi:hypothetical protein|nr:hypothetical protein [Candidatus Melainabacteria bacterium]
MGTNSHKNSAQLVTVGTDRLKERLNVLYAARRGQKDSGQAGVFDHLWDLKESAILEGKGSVEVPQSWLDELNDDTLTTDARSH